ncbi:hypothetical protein [Deinococcus petrolearius]|uniref:GPW/gp25 family protein n=1 Tax=Deinococcus petrolearius TaxID=1751295 RepID=A0ABW1DG16_9DEIO
MTLGTDFSTAAGLNGVLVSGRALLVESLARRLRTRRGALWYEPGYGSSLPDYLGESFDDGGAEAAAICEIDLEEDPRVLTATVTVTTATPSSISLLAQVDTVRGAVALVIEAGSASALYPASIEVAPYGVG